jgi:hypothetical protein
MAGWRRRYVEVHRWLDVAQPWRRLGPGGNGGGQTEVTHFPLSSHVRFLSRLSHVFLSPLSNMRRQHRRRRTRCGLRLIVWGHDLDFVRFRSKVFFYPPHYSIQGCVRHRYSFFDLLNIHWLYLQNWRILFAADKTLDVIEIVWAFGARLFLIHRVNTNKIS